MTTGGLGGQYGGDRGDGTRGTSYGGNPRDTSQSNDPFNRNRYNSPWSLDVVRKALGMDNAGASGASSFPFMFGVPPKDLVPNYMPQIMPMTPGNPQNVEQLYGMYGATPNAPMPVAPNVPQPPPDAGTQLTVPDVPFQLALARLLER